MMARKRFSEREVILTLLWCGNKIICGWCGEPFTIEQVRKFRSVHRDHIEYVSMGGPDTPENCQYLHAKCHAEKTDGKKHTSYGSDKHNIAKDKRLRGETKTGPKKKIQSRGFDKNVKQEYNSSTKRWDPVRRQ